MTCRAMPSSGAGLRRVFLLMVVIAAAAQVVSGQGGKCDKCNLAESAGGCKCDGNCDCITGGRRGGPAEAGPTGGKCDKCSMAESDGGCKCDSNCDCVGGSGPVISPSGGKCDKCNMAESDGGCKCDSNCDCVGGGATTASTQVAISNTRKVVMARADDFRSTAAFDLNTIRTLLDSACSDSACTEPQQQADVYVKQTGVTPGSVDANMCETDWARSNCGSLTNGVCSLTFSGSFPNAAIRDGLKGAFMAALIGSYQTSGSNFDHCTFWFPGNCQVYSGEGVQYQLPTFLKLTNYITTAGEEQNPAEGGHLEMRMSCEGSDQPSGCPPEAELLAGIAGALDQEPFSKAALGLFSVICSAV